jgi:predicted PurR-regulated permease PerM
MSEPSRPASKLVAVAAAMLIIALSLYLLIVGEAIFIPLVLAIFITYLLVAVAHALQRVTIRGHRLPEGPALAAATVLFLLGIAILVQLIAGNVRAVVDAAPVYQARLQDVITNINSTLAATFNRGQPLTVTSLLDQIDLRAIVPRMAGIFQGMASNTFQILIYVAFLLLEVNTFDRKLSAMLPSQSQQHALRGTLDVIGHKIERYVLIKTVMSMLTGLCSFAVLTAIGVDFAPFWGLLHFVLNFVPYVGAGIAITMPTVLTLLQFGEVATALLVAGVLIGVQVLVDNVLEPRLAGKTLNLSPIMIIIGLSVWGTMWGIIGMVLSVPIMVIVMIILSQFPRTRPVAVLMSENGEIR